MSWSMASLLVIAGFRPDRLDFQRQTDYRTIVTGQCA
jgi:hypothetical protein